MAIAKSTDQQYPNTPWDWHIFTYIEVVSGVTLRYLGISIGRPLDVPGIYLLAIVIFYFFLGECNYRITYYISPYMMHVSPCVTESLVWEVSSYSHPRDLGSRGVVSPAPCGSVGLESAWMNARGLHFPATPCVRRLTSLTITLFDL